ncbi:hypothetical protein LTR37_013923 [Vermiconidia calcicola]|uniref:Uncharacterized protein n=1 Tax=Vermiconidia calcicola TaxID=1690605 RepID=A0ACC3MUX0_9PEZI|nr:hypothetical protein LTR37_013923 [Vermiconidia calcicola]
MLIPAARYASTTPPKPRVLEKPERFNPPSHPSRLRTKPRQYPGPPISEHEREAQKTRRYPHMMPPEGSFMRWFLTNRILHMWITLGVLTSLVFAVWWGDFIHSTPYKDLLPPNSMFFEHPFSFLARYWQTYEMHVAYVSEQTAERRRRNVEDVRKRSEYRKAHGISQDETTFGGWTAKTDAEVMGPGMREGGGDMGASPGPVPKATMDLAKATMGNMQDKGEEETFVDFEGNKKTLRKKWFGIR